VIVVDTSVLIDFLRGRDTPAALRLVAIEQSATPYAIPGICCQELLQGAENQAQWNKLERYLSSQVQVHPVDPSATHVAAARIYFDCRRLGWSIRSSVDCWIAQLAIENDAVLLHDDDDFEKIARARPLRAMRA